MSVFKCKMCGGTIEFEAGATVGVCDSCGTKQTLPKTADDTVANLFNRANNLRLKCEFDRAAAIYEKIVEQDDSEAEAHWGIILCKYGIEYVDDPKTGRKIPTCHRTLFDAVTADADYTAAIDYSDASQQSIYESEAREIDRIQKDILSIVKNEKPFDVFICYKETDENGRRTQDSVIANDIYYQLTEEGFKVFYAAITLEDKLGQEYEPYIFAALSSAKVMLVVGTDPLYFNSVWVRNEWSRFIKLMKTDRSKLLIPCYRDMDAYELPEEFAHLQAQDMSKIGFINDVVRGIKKVISDKEPETVAERTAVGNTNTVNTTALLERALLFLEDGRWQDANIYCEKVLDNDPKNAEAYLVKLMAELRVKTRKQLADCTEPFDNRDNYSKVLRFGDEKLEAEMRGYIKHINERNEEQSLSSAYEKARSLMADEKNEKAYLKAADILETIPGYKDSDTLVDYCLEKADEIHKDTIYNQTLLLIKNTVDKKIAYLNAIDRFKSISGWRDADEQVIACEKAIVELDAKREAARIERERNEKEARIAAEKARKKRNILIFIGAVAFCVILAFFIILASLIIPDMKYNNAVDLFNSGLYEEAIIAFETVEGYKDSDEKKAESEINVLKNAEVGDIVTFGMYEQNGETSDGDEYIEWIVLAKEDNKALVISDKALDCQGFYSIDNNPATWATGKPRFWLNETFLTSAFSSEEQLYILSTEVSADSNPKYSTDPGSSANDKVFLLSITEVEKYFSSDAERMCVSSSYVYSNGAFAYASEDLHTCIWWTRTPGNGNDSFATVGTYGSINYSGDNAQIENICIRPAMWINLES